VRSLPAGLATELAKRARTLTRIHLLDVQTAAGANYFWSDFEGSFLSRLTGVAQQYKPWLKSGPTLKLSRSLSADYGEFHLQNLSGNTIDREVAALLAAGEFEGAYCICRRWYMPLDAAGFEFHGFASEPEVNGEEVIFRILQLFQPNEQAAAGVIQTQTCHWRFTSAQCGYRRGQLFVPLTTATIFGASAIGAAGLTLTPDLYKDELVMILSGTGAGQERYVSTHTATTFTLKSNWTTVPDATSKFIVTGPGTMKVGATVADAFGPNLIGNSGLSRTVNGDTDANVYIISGMGAGQFRSIVSNTATAFTVSPSWSTTPDATSMFVVIYKSCDKDRASCNARGVLERFSGIIHLQAQVTRVPGSHGVQPGSGSGPGGDPHRIGKGRIVL
jgi:hypothetical protein